jgi:hypothetical protein
MTLFGNGKEKDLQLAMRMQVYAGFVWLKTENTVDGLVVANTAMRFRIL